MRDGELATHFEFGKNWAEFSGLIDEARIAQALEGVERLVGPGTIAGKTFLDIGCGSGIHCLAALQLGASHVVAVDLDPHSVTTTRQVLSRFASDTPCEVREQSVFDLDPGQMGVFDVVYAWGSLHHTGALLSAWRFAAQLVAPGGILIVAVYRKTRLCRLWKMEKWLYSRSPAWLQGFARALYIAAMRLAFLLTGRSFRAYRDNYGKRSRGMDYYRDVHDWLGGYPYESISPAEADEFRRSIGFVPVQTFVEPRMPLGLFGSGNDEYVWQRPL
jgi:2-polyprenyl-6-hydroxyphenyl methylase/3-demethylubiquinone-9 3-methyltransferase